MNSINFNLQSSNFDFSSFFQQFDATRAADSGRMAIAEAPIEPGLESSSATTEATAEVPLDPRYQALEQETLKLASDESLWHWSMKRAMGDRYDNGAVETMRVDLLQRGGLPLIESERHRPGAADLENAGEIQAATLTEAEQEVAGRSRTTIDPSQSVATELLRRMGVTDADGSIANGIAATLDPTRNADMERYLALPAADESQTPTLLNFGGLAYGSTPFNEGLAQGSFRKNDTSHYCIAHIINTPPIVSEIDRAGIANTLNPEWQAAVMEAATLNGGLGNSQDGFLAYSAESGFVRLRNPGLTPEQNRRLAEMSLTMGVSIDVLPSWTENIAYQDHDTNKSVTDVISRFDNELAQFKADPKANGMCVSNGRRKVRLEYNEEAGRFVSYDFKRSGGFRGVAQRHLGDIGPVLDALAVVVNVVPGIGQAASIAIATGSQALKAGMTYAVTGDLSAQQIASVALSAIPGGGAMGLTATQMTAAKGLVNAAAQYSDTGSFDASSLIQSLAPSVFKGIPALEDLDPDSVSALSGILAGAADGKFDSKDILNIARLVDSELGITDTLKDEARDLFGSFFGDEAGGIGSITGGLVQFENGEIDVDDLFLEAAKVVGHAVVNGEVRARDIAGLLGPVLWEQLEPKGVGNEKAFTNRLRSIGGMVDAGQFGMDDLAMALAPLLVISMSNSNSRRVA